MKTFGKIAFLLGMIALLTYVLIRKYDIGRYFINWSEEDIENNNKNYMIQLRTAMLNREEEVELTYHGSSDKIHEYVSNAIDEVFRVDDEDTTSDFDYLKYCYLGTEIRIQGILDSYTVTYHFSYNETKEQTEIVDERICLVLEELKLDKLNELEKIKKIHDFIVSNASYDVDAKKNSAYDNLINKTSVCQGYALLTYKLMKEAGIDCRIITGEGKGASHAWNIVKLNGEWYNIDCTWDDPVSADHKSHLEYTYFLKSDEDFKDHIRDKEFATEEFYSEYPTAEKSY